LEWLVVRFLERRAKATHGNIVSLFHFLPLLVGAFLARLCMGKGWEIDHIGKKGKGMPCLALLFVFVAGLFIYGGSIRHLRLHQPSLLLRAHSCRRSNVFFTRDRHAVRWLRVVGFTLSCVAVVAAIHECGRPLADSLTVLPVVVL
jgi:hypothetical protein